ncbi:MAG: phosphoribosylglycinamide formyltransferase [Chitinophagaceae bacterium]|nr:phosphoribosylglycinamide formyltransferase [Chitinophagaceae bacterium]
MKVLKDKSGVWSLESGVENKSRLRREGVEDERKSRLFIHNSFNQKQPQTTDHRLQTTPLLQTPNSRLQTQIALFASGTGTNAEKIIDHLRDHPSITVALVVCNKPGAGVLQVAERNGIPVLLIEKERFFRGDAYLAELAAYGIDFIVLAGFLWKIPESLIRAFPRRIVNIHPALLPKYGGKGMYGSKVHEAVLAAGEKQTGITIHYVNEHFDEGEHIFQASCDLAETDTAEDIARKVHALEHEHFPQVVERLVMEAVNQG